MELDDNEEYEINLNHVWKNLKGNGWLHEWNWSQSFNQ
jgi:hypothetical protein